MTMDEAVCDIVKEYRKAKIEYGPFASYHEGYAIVLEEVDELWAEVKKKGLTRRSWRVKKEVRQAGAMCLRFLIDLCDSED